MRSFCPNLTFAIAVSYISPHNYGTNSSFHLLHTADSPSLPCLPLITVLSLLSFNLGYTPYAAAAMSLLYKRKTIHLCLTYAPFGSATY